jgi:hypothetical protein
MTSPENIGQQFAHTITYLPHVDRDGNPHHAFQMRDQRGNLLGHLNLNEHGTIVQVETRPEVRRQGIATALYNYAKSASEKDPSIPAPKHASSRTPSGNSWARAVVKSEGGTIQPPTHKVSNSTYAMRGAMWEMMLPLQKDN